MENKSTDSGIGFRGLLTIAFIVLKLCNVITWSWWWIFAPIWIPLCIGIISITLLLFFER